MVTDVVGGITVDVEVVGDITVVCEVVGNIVVVFVVIGDTTVVCGEKIVQALVVLARSNKQQIMIQRFRLFILIQTRPFSINILYLS
jgi:hypothetical protein